MVTSLLLLLINSGLLLKRPAHHTYRLLNELLLGSVFFIDVLGLGGLFSIFLSKYLNSMIFY